MSQNNMGVDAAGQRVIHFQAEALNLSRRAVLSDLIIEMFKSKDWRNYSNALGRERWRECEFDYFLIASDISYEDAVKTFSWKEQGRAVAAATQSDDPQQRRTLENAAAAWHAPGPETLIQRAKRLGWIANSGEQLLAVASERARTYARYGMDKDQYQRQQRERKVKARRTKLDRIAKQVLQQVSDKTELRYVVDYLRKQLTQKGRPDRTNQHNQWARDVRRFKGNIQALVTHWGVTKAMAYRRMSILKPRLKYTQRKAS